MKHLSRAMDESFKANTAEPALPGCWCCPLLGEAAKSCFEGEK